MRRHLLPFPGMSDSPLPDSPKAYLRLFFNLGWTPVLARSKESSTSIMFRPLLQQYRCNCGIC